MRLAVLTLAVVGLAGCKQAPSDRPAVTKAEATKIAEQAEANFTNMTLREKKCRNVWLTFW